MLNTIQRALFECLMLSLNILFVNANMGGLLDARPISSMGKTFTFFLPNITLLEGGVIYYAQISSKKDARLQIMFKYSHSDAAYVNNLKKQGGLCKVYHYRELCDCDLSNVYDLNFHVISDVDIQITTFLGQKNAKSASFHMLPDIYWGRRYACVGLLYSLIFIVVNAFADNPVQFQCNQMNDIYKTTSLQVHMFTIIDWCSIIDRVNYMSHSNKYKGVMITSKLPIGLIAFSKDNGYNPCPHDQTYLAINTPLPTTALGTDFVTLSTSILRGKSDIVVMATQDDTVVTVSGKKNESTKHYLDKAMDVYTFIDSLGPQMMFSNRVVQVTFFLRPPCVVGRSSIGDVSFTDILPTSLFYNEYFIDTPSETLLNNYVLFVITKLGVSSLTMKSHNIDSISWTAVWGSDDWLLGEKYLNKSVDTLTSNKNFGCYVFGLKTDFAYIESAGFQSCDMSSPQKLAEECKSLKYVKYPSAKYGGEFSISHGVIFSKFFTIVINGFACFLVRLLS